MPRLLLVTGDPLLERRFAVALEGLCLVAACACDPAAVRRAAIDGTSLIAIDGDPILGAGLALADTIACAAGILPGAPLLVIGDDDDASSVLKAVRAGATDVIARSEDSMGLRDHCARHLSTLALTAAQGGFELVLDSLPGTAAAFATDLAVTKARAGGGGLLIDCTLPQSLAGILLDIDLGYTAANALQDMERMDRLLVDSVLARHEPSMLRVLPLAASSHDAVDAISPDAILALAVRLGGFFPGAVVNAGSIRHAGLLRGLAAQAEAIRLVAPQTIAAIHVAKALIERLDPDEACRERLMLVVEDHDPTILLSPEQIAQALGIKRVKALAGGHAARANALNAGCPLVLDQPLSARARCVAEIAGTPRSGAPGASLADTLMRFMRRSA